MTPSAREYLAKVGEKLREARIEAGEDLHHVAETLRIRPAYLQALESGDYDTFPGRAYAYGFLRAYADYLGFDGNEVVRRVRRVLEETAPARSARPHRPLVERHRPTALAAAALALLAGAGYFGWYALGAFGPKLTGGLLDAPGELARVADAVVTGGERTGADEADSAEALRRRVLVRLTARDEVPEITPRITPEAIAELVMRREGGGDATSAIAAELPRRPAPAAAGERTVPLGAHSVMLRAKRTTWVQVYAPDGSFTDTRTLERGQTFEVPRRPGLLLWVGDGGAVEVVVDGSSRGPVGADGQVVDGFPLDPARMPPARQG